MAKGHGGDLISAKLRKSGEFQWVFAQGHKVVGRRLVVWTLPRFGQPFRYGIIASRKVGNAVTRNRCKRRIRELIRANIDYYSPGYDLVVVARGGLADCSWPEARSDFEKTIHKAGVLADPPAC